MSNTQTTRGDRQRLRGLVVRDKAAKTITVEVVRRLRHPRYGKMVRRHTRLAAHDPANEARVGDTVEICACRPLSKNKRYRLARIVERGPGEALVGQPPARPEAERPEPQPAPAGDETAEVQAGEADQAAEAPEAAEAEKGDEAVAPEADAAGPAEDAADADPGESPR